MSTAPKMAKAIVPSTKTLVKGTKVIARTGSRWGDRTYKGTVIAFVPAGQFPKTVPKDLQRTRIGVDTSNRDRYLVQLPKDGSRFVNAVSVTKVS